TVDPSLSLPASSSTFADTALPGDNSASPLLRVGTPDGTEKADSFLQFSTFGATFKGASVTNVSLNLFDVYAAAASCTAATPFSVYQVTQVWSPSGVSSYPGPSIGSSALGTLSQTPAQATCNNTGRDPNTGTWMSVGLPAATFQSWA